MVLMQRQASTTQRACPLLASASEAKPTVPVPGKLWGQLSLFTNPARIATTGGAAVLYSERVGKPTQ